MKEGKIRLTGQQEADVSAIEDTLYEMEGIGSFLHDFNHEEEAVRDSVTKACARYLVEKSRDGLAAVGNSFGLNWERTDRKAIEQQEEVK